MEKILKKVFGRASTRSSTKLELNASAEPRKSSSNSNGVDSAPAAPEAIAATFREWTVDAVHFDVLPVAPLAAGSSSGEPWNRFDPNDSRSSSSPLIS